MAYLNLDLDVYRTLIAKGLSEADAERWATRASTLRLPALFAALISTTCPVELAYAAVEEVADYYDRQRSPLQAIGRNRNLWLAVLQVAIALALGVLALRGLW